jgi:hypothetical protein
MKSTRMMEFLTMMPAPAMKPIMDMAVKRDWSHDDQRSFERFEPADNQDVDKPIPNRGRLRMIRCAKN